MKNILSILALFLITVVQGQKSPALHVGEKQLALSSLHIRTAITGNRAITTYDMTFYNATQRVLEGELRFPLGEGQEIARLALEINGKLREAVVVEKEKGRATFEAIVRRGVDPALLEKGKGNSYTLRVYPIPAKGYKRVVVAYEEELLLGDNSYTYHLPLHFKQEVKDFLVAMEVVQQKLPPKLREGEEAISFSKWRNTFRTEFKRTNYIPNKSMVIELPMKIAEEKLIVSSDYFYFYKNMPLMKRKRKAPKKITLFWDTSLSMMDRDIEKEIALLESYFSTLPKVELQLVLFSNRVHFSKKFILKKGEWSDVKERLKNAVYDGGTCYEDVFASHDMSDMILCFSDGMATLSGLAVAKNTPVFIVNSKTEAAHNKWNAIAEQTKGSYLNLDRMSLQQALHSLHNLNLSYLGYRSASANMEVYRAQSSQGPSNFSVTGKSFLQGEKITLLFGFGEQVVKEVSLTLQKNTDEELPIQRVWAKNKVQTLLKEEKRNQKEILHTAMQYSLVTDYTSFIVLETVQDYIRYDITPPEELLEAYYRIKNRKAKGSINTGAFSRSNGLPEQIEVVDDEMKIEETVIEATETDEAEAVVIEDIVEYTEEEEIVEDVPFAIIEEAPTFPSCSSFTNAERKACLHRELSAIIQNNFAKDIANQLDLPGGSKRIFVRFKIGTSGEIHSIMARAPHERLKQEAIRVVKLIPRLFPGKQRGRPVEVSYTLPITISVDGETMVNSNVVRSTSRNNGAARQHNNMPKHKETLQVEKRELQTPYIHALEFFKDKETAYLFYLRQRESYKELPHYYLDVSNFFYSKFKTEKYAARILSNMAELYPDSYQELKAFAYVLEERKAHKQALFVYQRILELRPEDIQSHRDVALAYQNMGLCQKAYAVFWDIISGKIYEEHPQARVFKGMEAIAKQEIKLLYAAYKEDLDPTMIPEAFRTDKLGYDLRVVIDWNHNDTDIDLHIIDPNREECYYAKPTTKQGGVLSKDRTEGFGPECFHLKKAQKGFYYVKINYFGDRKQKLETPTFLKVTIYKNQGKKNASKEVRVIRLTRKDKEEIVAKVKI